jgi:predicted nucleic acid-binding protein
MEQELILCDTNIFINWFAGNTKTIEALKNIGLTNILIPSVTVMELFQGIQNNQELAKLKKKLKNYNIIHYNEKSSGLAIQLIEKYKLSHNLLIPDAIIAAIAITYDLKLFTYNLKDFNYIPGIKLYKTDK